MYQSLSEEEKTKNENMAAKEKKILGNAKSKNFFFKLSFTQMNAKISFLKKVQEIWWD